MTPCAACRRVCLLVLVISGGVSDAVEPGASLQADQITAATADLAGIPLSDFRATASGDDTHILLETISATFAHGSVSGRARFAATGTAAIEARVTDINAAAALSALTPAGILPEQLSITGSLNITLAAAGWRTAEGTANLTLNGVDLCSWTSLQALQPRLAQFTAMPATGHLTLTCTPSETLIQGDLTSDDQLWRFGVRLRVRYADGPISLTGSISQRPTLNAPIDRARSILGPALEKPAPTAFISGSLDQIQVSLREQAP